LFKHNIVYSEGGFRTPSMGDAFADKYLNANKKWLLFVEQPLVLSGQTPFCSGNDRYLKQLSKLLEVLDEISENNNSNCKPGGAEDQIINDKGIFLHPGNENNTQ
jgi:hypothetical protein